VARLSGAAVALAAALLVAGRAAPARADAEDDDEASAEKAAAEAAPGGDACIDEDVKADLFAKRKQRTSRDRLFQQTNRHELTAQGGYYVSDLFDGTYTAGAAYTYHMTEDLGVEASWMYTRLASAGGPELERTFAVLQNRPRSQNMFAADLIWAFTHAKMRLGGSITHFDVYLAAGGGLVDSVLAFGIAGNGGLGLKFFLGRMVALRFDVRDYVFREQLLSQTMIVNDLTTTLGLSVFFPRE